VQMMQLVGSFTEGRNGSVVRGCSSNNPFGSGAGGCGGEGG